MHEALIENWIRMIPWRDFWEPDTTKHKCIKWGTILLVLLLGVSIFLTNLDDMQAYEYACKNPIIVEAKQTVKVTQSWFSGTTCYDLYLSYHYDGVDYNDILYRNTQNPNYMFADVDTITVAVAPNDPSIPIIRMFNEGPITFAVVLCLLGLSMLIYGILIELPLFRDWRIRQENRRRAKWKPHTCANKFATHPDYFRDLFMVFAPLAFISYIILEIIFPYTF
jgi:hypothetical protein